MNFSQHCISNEKGFTLIELAVVITISALLIAGAIKMMEPYLTSVQRNTTEKKLNNIADAISLYAQHYNRLPCPADPKPANEPFGYPRASGADGSVTDLECGKGVDSYVGIIPFKVLGLNESMIYDGYDNLITYAVSPALGAYTMTDAFDKKVHAKCRTPAWIETLGQTPSNRNPDKAAFCCPRYYPDPTLSIHLLKSDGSGESVFTGVLSDNISDYELPNVLVGNSVDPLNQMIAFTLISHGDNGDGAFLLDGTQNPITGNPSAPDAENANIDLTFLDGELTQSPPERYFDDIVVWRTNNQVMSAFDNNSCLVP